MRRRPSALWLGVLLVAPALAARERAARADQVAPGTAKYSLTNTSNAPISLVDLAIQPPGSVVPPMTTDPKTGQQVAGNPFSVVAGSSNGFAQVDDSLGTITGKQQVLELSFGLQPVIDPKTGMPEIGSDNRPMLQPVQGPNGQAVGGLQPGGTLTFSLALGASSQPPQLLPTPSSADLVKLQLLSNPPTNTDSDGKKTTPTASSNPIVTSTPSSGGTTINVVTPEPISLAIWAFPAALGFLRVRARRRSG